MLVHTEWRDEYIAANYPNAFVLREEATGEIVVCLGEYVGE